jgi:hypothetical protein
MSLLKQFNPKRIRKKSSESFQESNLKEKTHLSSVHQKIESREEKKNINEMINEYSYKEETDIQPQEKVIKKESNRAGKVGLYELNFFCEEYLKLALLGPTDIKLKQIQLLEKEFIAKKLEVFSEYSKDIKMEKFEDKLYYYKGEVILPEEYINISGFLREYFDIKEVIILYNTGELIKRKSYYCKFWDETKLDNLFNLRFGGDRPKVLFDDNCLDCNMTCAFRRLKQMNN